MIPIYQYQTRNQLINVVFGPLSLKIDLGMTPSRILVTLIPLNNITPIRNMQLTQVTNLLIELI